MSHLRKRRYIPDVEGNPDHSNESQSTFRASWGPLLRPFYLHSGVSQVPGSGCWRFPALAPGLFPHSITRLTVAFAIVSAWPGRCPASSSGTGSTSVSFHF